MKRRVAPSPEEVGGGSASSVKADFVTQFSKVVNSTLAEDSTKAVLYNIAGIAGIDITDDPDGTEILFDDDDGEGIDGAEVFGALGILARPLPPEVVSGQSKHLEALCLRTADGLVPLAYRDLRVKMGGDGPAEGTIALVGYGGGFHSLSAVDDGAQGTLHVIYCPYDFDSNGNAQKAHSIILDPTSGNESITIAHADGMAMSMFDGALVMKNASGDATFRLDSNGVTITATNIVLSGGVIVGEPAVAVALLAGAASQASTKFYLSP